MGRRQRAQVRVFDLQTRNDRPKNPYVVRWIVENKERSRAFPLKVTAEDFRYKIIAAIQDREDFATESGLPRSWDLETMTLASWTKEWIQEQRSTWEPATRKTAVEALTLLLLIMVKPNATAQPATIKKDIAVWMMRANVDCPAWLKRFSVSLASIDERACEIAAKKLYEKTVRKGEELVQVPRKPSTVDRYRNNVAPLFKGAVERGYLKTQPWPAPKRGKKRNKQRTKTKVVQVEKLPTLETAFEAINRLVSHQPGSKGYRVIAACILLAGLRPGEARAVRVENLFFPTEDGESGTIYIDIADKRAGSLYTDEDEEFGPPKTDERYAPMTPALAAILKEHVGTRTEGLLVTTRSGSVVTQSNFRRAWERARGNKTWTPYDLRHTCATNWLRANIDIRIIANWLGHAPSVLLDQYAGAMEGSYKRAAELAAGLFNPSDLTSTALSADSEVHPSLEEN
jgi:integrase